MMAWLQDHGFACAGPGSYINGDAQMFVIGQAAQLSPCVMAFRECVRGSNDVLAWVPASYPFLIGEFAEPAIPECAGI